MYVWYIQDSVHIQLTNITYWEICKYGVIFFSAMIILLNNDIKYQMMPKTFKGCIQKTENHNDSSI